MQSINELDLETPLGLSVLDSLRAEDEPWLTSCYVPPQEIERVMGDRSVVVFGSIGSGKTALYHMIKAVNRGPAGKMKRLLVDWRLKGNIENSLAPTSMVQRQIMQIYDLCAAELADYIACHPEDYKAAPTWAQARMIWFLHTYLNDPFNLRLGPTLDRPTGGAQLLQDLLQTTTPEVLYENAPLEMVRDELVSALRSLGLSGIWILADDIERWSQFDERQMVDNLTAMLATLPLFEHAEFVFKLCVPLRLESAISSASGLVRRRINSYRLRWTLDQLHHIVNSRLRLATGIPTFDIDQLCRASGLQEWLENVGAESPRDWLDQIRPLVEYYLTHQLNEPIGDNDWKELKQQHPPHIYLDDARRLVWVGGREISLDTIPTKAFDMLAYLYHQGGRIVSKSELYYRVYCELDSIPRTSEDAQYQAPKEYEGLIDTSIWRLRKAIEPDRKHPVLLVTKRGHGIKLSMRW